MPDSSRHNAAELKSPVVRYGAISSALLIVVGLIEGLDKLFSLYRLSPILHGGLLYLLTVGFIVGSVDYFGPRWRGQAKRRVQLIGILLATAIFGMVVIYPRLCLFTFLSFCGPAEWRPLHVSEVFFPPVLAKTKASQDLVILSFSVDSSRSSFILIEKDPPEISFRQNMSEVFRQATCDTFEAEKPIEAVLPIWRDLLEKRGERDIASLLADYKGYRHLILNGGGTQFQKAAPTGQELESLLKTDKSKFDAMMRWLVQCVGLADPVLIWELRNDSDRQLLLTAVDYIVSAVSQIRGAAPQAVEPIDVMAHDLEHATGTQRRNLLPRVSVDPGQTVSIRVRYRLDARDWGYTWMLKAAFVAADGTRAESREFEMIAAKGPQMH
ncbi:hypothetical protein ABIA99_003731 [Bradyrhizobium sp. LB12.1]|uniref:hypothetical protein n=1 Tax=Bradyrhizobium sp. LB12.1 TaxID=3156327 RepID=UPI00339B45E0